MIVSADYYLELHKAISFTMDVFFLLSKDINGL